MSTIHCCFKTNSVVPNQIMDAMLNSSDYWNPDNKTQSTNTHKSCILGKANLYNTALSVHDHVYTDAKSGCMITANARIDNREAILSKLKIQGSLIPDGQLILLCYLKWGKACVKQLLGDFAFIIWDEAAKKTFAARDHFGVKLLLYNQQENGTMISNEPKAFFDSGWMTKTIKESWLVKEFWGLLSSKVETAYHGLELLPAAHFLELDAQGLRTERYWQLPDHDELKNRSKEALLEEFKHLFKNAVKVRMDSEYPLACQLSEGLDSNGIAGYAARFTPQKDIYTFSYQNKELNDETRPIWEKTYADIFDMLAMHSNLKPIWTNKAIAKDASSRLIENTAGAISSTGQFMHHCELAAQKKARVMLSGWGGDHCVSSPGDFYESELFSAFKWKALNNLLKDKQKRGRIGSCKKVWLRLFIKHYFPTISKKIIVKRGGLEHSMLSRHQQSVLKTKYIEQHQLSKVLNDFVKNYQSCYSTKDYSQRELFEIGVEKRIIDSELTARMYGMEYRFPMLDVPLVEFAYNLPSYLKTYQGIERYSFRHIIKGVTTERIRLRQKADVNHPDLDFSRGLSDYEKEQIKGCFNNKLFSKYLEKDAVEQFLQNNGIIIRRSLPVFTYFSNQEIKVE